MKTRSFVPAAVALCAALVLPASAATAGSTRVVRRGPAIRAQAASSAAISYSVEVPIVTRIVGRALYRTAIDISNNTAASPVVARFQYCYNRTNPAGFFCTPQQSVNLLAFDNFHTDDFVGYLGAIPDALEPGAAESSFGTLLVTFEGLLSSQGWEGTVFARTYSPDPAGAGTVAIAYPASLFFESANASLVATIRDTQTLPTEAGALRTNIGIRNTDIRGTTQSVTVEVSFYDVTTGSPTNGQRVGSVLTLPNLQPGQVLQLNDIRTMAAIPSGVTAMLAFADVVGAVATGPTIEGYVNILDSVTQDGAFFEMKCADTDGCDN